MIKLIGGPELSDFKGKKLYSAITRDFGNINNILKVTGKKGILELTKSDMAVFFNTYLKALENKGTLKTKTVPPNIRSLPMQLSEHLNDMFGKKPFWKSKDALYKELRTDQEGESVAIKGIQKKLLNIKYKTELCKSWIEKGKCCYGSHCKFAHGKE